MTPYYQESGITIYHGDCREVLPSVSADCLVSDPPYGIAHPTNYKARGRGKLASCADYPPVYGDDAEFDPRWIVAVGLFGNKERPDDLDQATCELGHQYTWLSSREGVLCAASRKSSNPASGGIPSWR